MKMHKMLYARALPWLFAAAAVAVGLADSQPADAAFTATLSTAAVNVVGVVVGAPANENVRFTGTVTINAKAVTDPDFGGPTNVVLSIDLSGLSGTGLMTGSTYVTPAHPIVVRPLVTADRVDFTFPFFLAGAPENDTGRLGNAAVTLVFNTALMTLLNTSTVVVQAP